ncbi:MAG: hypothetical protein Ct9H300mP22_5810 [Gammaproteobacteria bacterium]|nr:MAG: hypothetical protein Ct9H300mP22_5810 [Gammaproteobacteria bacterium]
MIDGVLYMITALNQAVALILPQENCYGHLTPRPTCLGIQLVHLAITIVESHTGGHKESRILFATNDGYLFL